MPKSNRLWLYALLAAGGALAVALGGFVITDPALKTVSGVCIGLGSASFALGVGNIIGAFTLSKSENEEILRRKAIEVNDERNVRIKEKVGAKINQVVVYVLSLIILTLGLMGADVFVLLLLSSVLVLELVLAIVLTNYYAKIL